MAWAGYRRVSSAFEWFWRTILFLWRYFSPALYSVIGYARKAITWRKGSRGRQDEVRERAPERDQEAAAGAGESGHNDGETEPSEIPVDGVYEHSLLQTNTFSILLYMHISLTFVHKVMI